MNSQLLRVRTRRVLGAGFAVIALSFLVLFVPIIGYAIVLALRARGVPDQAEINSFAATLSPALMPWVERILTPVVAFWTVRFGRVHRSIDGLLAGLLAGLLSVGVTMAFGGAPAIGSVGSVVLLAGLGGLGGFVAQKMAGKSRPSVRT